MHKKIITSHSEKETLALGQSYAQSLNGGEIIALNGQLGAGKTVFVKGLAAGLGIKQNVNSPTFTIMKIYPVTKPDLAITTLVHIDAYRLENAADLEAIGATEYFGRPDTVVLIEWAEKIKKLIKNNVIKVNIEILDNNKRKIYGF